jgi:hypothetical protein
MAVKIQLRRDDAANWVSANTVLDAGEVGVEIDTNKFKIGDGVSSWNVLDYPQISDQIDSIDDISDVTITDPQENDILVYTSSGWENAPLNIPDISGDSDQIVVATRMFS